MRAQDAWGKSCSGRLASNGERPVFEAEGWAEWARHARHVWAYANSRTLKHFACLLCTISAVVVLFGFQLEFRGQGTSMRSGCSSGQGLSWSSSRGGSRLTEALALQ